MKPMVIFVDDDPNVRESIKRITRHQPYRTLVLESARLCVETLAVTDVQVLVTDLSMPGFNGQSLVNYFKDNKPEVIRIVLSGKLDLQITLDLINKGGVFRCLEKPCAAPILLSVIDEGLKAWKEKRGGILLAKPAPAETTRQDDHPTSLIRDALEEVERLEQSLKEHCERGRPIFTK